MVDIERSAEAVWTGEIRGGNGTINSTSGVLSDTAYSFATRFEQAPGTNPEELLAAAHAACYSMAFSATLGRHGVTPQRIETRSVCHLTPQQGGFKISKFELHTTGQVDGIDQATFQQYAEEAEKACPVSNLYRNNAEITVEAQLA